MNYMFINCMRRFPMYIVHVFHKCIRMTKMKMSRQNDKVGKQRHFGRHSRLLESIPLTPINGSWKISRGVWRMDFYSSWSFCLVKTDRRTVANPGRYRRNS